MRSNVGGSEERQSKNSREIDEKRYEVSRDLVVCVCVCDIEEDGLFE